MRLAVSFVSPRARALSGALVRAVDVVVLVALVVLVAFIVLVGTSCGAPDGACVSSIDCVLPETCIDHVCEIPPPPRNRDDDVVGREGEGEGTAAGEGEGEGIAASEGEGEGTAASEGEGEGASAGAVCGDGVVQGGASGSEACDDGNDDPLDACDACQATRITVGEVLGSMSVQDIALPLSIARVGDDVWLLHPTGISKAPVDTALAQPFRRVFGRGAFRRIDAIGEGIVDGLPMFQTAAQCPDGRVVVNDRARGVVVAIADGATTIVAGTGAPPTTTTDPSDFVLASTPDAVAIDPIAVACDSIGRLYIASQSDGRVLRVDVDGTTRVFAGAKRNGNFGTPAQELLVTRTTGVAVFDDDTVAIAVELGAQRRVFLVSSINGGLERTLLLPDNTGIGQVSPDGVGGVLVTTSNGIHRFAPVGISPAEEELGRGSTVGTSFAVLAPGVVAYIEGNAVLRFDVATHTSTRLTHAGLAPRAVAIAPDGRIAYTTDDDVFLLDATTHARTLFVSEEAMGTCPVPAGLDPVGNDLEFDRASSSLFLSRTNDQTVCVVTSTGDITELLGGAVRGVLAFPEQLAATNNSRQLYMVDRCAIDAAGAAPPFLVYGDTSSCALTTGATPRFSPVAIAVQMQGAQAGAADTLFVLDTTGRVLSIPSTTGVATAIAGVGSTCSAAAGDGGPATSACLFRPTDLALDAQGRVLVADDRGARVRRFTIGGTIETLAGGALLPGDARGPAAGFWGITSLAVAADGSVLAADQFKLRRIDAVTGDVTTIVGTDQFVADGSFGAAQLAGPVALSCHAQTCVVVDGITQTLRRIDFVGAQVQTFASSEARPITLPGGVALLDDGTVLVTERSFDRVLRIQPDGTRTTLASGATIDDPTAVVPLVDGSVAVLSRGENIKRISGASTLPLSSHAGTVGLATDGARVWSATSTTVSFTDLGLSGEGSVGVAGANAPSGIRALALDHSGNVVLATDAGIVQLLVAALDPAPDIGTTTQAEARMLSTWSALSMRGPSCFGGLSAGRDDATMLIADTCDGSLRSVRVAVP